MSWISTRRLQYYHNKLMEMFRIRTYTSLEQIGLTEGSETIEKIASKLPNTSMLVTITNSNNAAIYPSTNGVLEVSRYDSNRVVFRWTQKDSGSTFIGSFTNNTWSGWNKLSVEFNSLSQIGLTSGSETIESIVSAMPDNTSLSYPISASSAGIYPTNYGLVTVKRVAESRVEFHFLSTGGVAFFGIYNGEWNGWKQVADAAAVPTLLAGTAIPSDVDLNDYKTPGNYHCSQSAYPATISNCPVDKAFRLEVFYANGTNYYIAQRLTDYASGTEYYRLYVVTSDKWNDWSVLNTTKTVTTLPSQGTALSANTIYNVSEAVGTYAFAAPSKGWAHGTFTTGSSVSVSFSGKFLGAAPSIEASKTYEFDVHNGVWAVQEVVSV